MVSITSTLIMTSPVFALDLDACLSSFSANSSAVT